MDQPTVFPPDFLWGVATSAHQVEGQNTNNQWSRWERSGRILSGDRCDRACDWWRDFDRDFDIAQQLGVNAMRISVEWSRVEPEEGTCDGTALLRYRRMLESLHRRGMRPFITLHHFTHPIWFEDLGGFLSDRSVYYFERFSRRVVDALGDLCSDWTTINEPNVFTALGYHVGYFPPGLKGRVVGGARVTVNLLRAHAAVYRMIHSLQPNANVGWAHHYLILHPFDHGSRLDHYWSRAHDRLFNENFLESIESGRAPFPLNLTKEDLSDVKGTCDYVGLNYYSRLRVAFDHRQRATLFARLIVPEDVFQGDRGVENPYGEAYVEGLHDAIARLARLGKPVYVLENGVPDRTDRCRPALLREASAQLERALRDGYDVRGYFHWTLTDNFEWNEGWHLRFGLVELDVKTQDRKLRPSAHEYARLIQLARASQIAPSIA
jgi:beta-glucosidase